MPSIVTIDATRRIPGRRGAADTYVPCPLTQCDIVVKVCLRCNDGEKQPLANVQVTLVGYAHTADTDNKGIAKFIGYQPVGGRESKTIQVALQGNDALDYAWFDFSAGKLKGAPPYPATDSLAKTVNSNHEELFYFEAAEQQSVLEIEINRSDNKPLPARVALTVTPNPAAPNAITTGQQNTLYRGIRVSESEAQRKWLGLREGTVFNSDRIVLNANPGNYTVRLSNMMQVLAEQRHADRPLESWGISPPGAIPVNVNVPDGGEARVIYTLSLYSDIQFIAFQVQPGPKGNANLAEDIKVRCEILKKAIEQARPHADAAPNVLKVFMGPEFYFQGPQGTYPLDLVEGVKGNSNKPGILPTLRKFIKNDLYKDWLFVFGTAIGGLKHEGAQPPYRLRITPPIAGAQITVAKDPSHPGSDPAICAYILNIAGRQWRVEQSGVSANVTGAAAQQDGTYHLTFAAAPAFAVGKCNLHQPGTSGVHILKIVNITAAPHILTVAAGRDKTAACQDITPLWTAVQPGGVSSVISKAVRSAAVQGAYDLHVANTAGFANNQLVYLFEPDERTEVFNIALIAKGGPDPQNPGDIEMPPVNRSGMLRELLVYKEHVSSIDYTAPVGPRNWWDATGAGRRVMFGANIGTVQPTQGSRDTLGGIDSIPASTGQSEVTRNSLGGGSVFTIDGITFGMEVCLDHAQKKLDEFYLPGGGAKPGDCYPQIHLIPSCGMTIGRGPVRAVPNGLCLNVDAFGDVVLRRNDRRFSCDQHPAVAQLNVGECGQNDADHKGFCYCPQPHNQHLNHNSHYCWCNNNHTAGAPRACPCGQNLVQTPWGQFRCPRGHTLHAAGACWCAANHTVAAAGACQCGRTLVRGQRHYCTMPHNFGGLHWDGSCWCGQVHAAAARGNCACGQGLIAAVPGWYKCPREHSQYGVHGNGACWCTRNHSAVAPLDCVCGNTLKAGRCHTCTRPHAQAVKHSEGTCAGACTQTHTNMAPGNCTVCTHPLAAGQVHACPGFWEQLQRHYLGQNCSTCGGAHTLAAPGACATCTRPLVQGQYFYCERLHNLNPHPENVACPCGILHTAAAPGACVTCQETLTRASFYQCAGHPGIQYTPNCATCNALLPQENYFFCRLHDVSGIGDAAGNCPDCNAVMRGAPFFSCDGFHNQANPGVTNANCPRCGTAPRATPYYYCTALHNQTDLTANGGPCAACNQGRIAIDYFYCDRQHSMLRDFDRRSAGQNCLVCARPLTRVNYFYCPGKHAHHALEDPAPAVLGNCATPTCQTPRVRGREKALRPSGTAINPAWGPHNVDLGTLRDSAGPVAWLTYFNQQSSGQISAQISVFPAQQLQPGETVP